MTTKELTGSRMKLQLTEELSNVSKEIERLVDKKITLQFQLRGLSNDPLEYLDQQSLSQTFLKEKIFKSQLIKRS